MPYDPSFYEERLTKAKDPRSAVWDGTPGQWDRCKRETKEILKDHIEPGMWVLDAGCGIGELIECFPDPDAIHYFGIDYCAGFIQEARKRYPNKFFEVADLCNLPGNLLRHPFDIVVCRTVEGVIGESAWGGVVQSLLRMSPKILVFRAMLGDGEMSQTVKVVTR